MGLCRKLLDACLVVAEKGNAEMLRVMVRTPCTCSAKRHSAFRLDSFQAHLVPVPVLIPWRILLSSRLSACAFMQGILVKQVHSRA